MGKITKFWSMDRRRLVADMEQMRQESEEMKEIALNACREASVLVERVKKQAKARADARQRAKAVTFAIPFSCGQEPRNLNAIGCRKNACWNKRTRHCSRRARR